ncbi:hypothetical protein [Oceanobacillus manasiensis]|uniref:hypothetical protein n=1 Tax=Oceanobacillus manasiensis TaxID=586413 RepID=UPI0005A68C11|nr:hypothetical protein [Oceanobacillus manasiensis]
MAKPARDFKREQQVWKGASPELKRQALDKTQNFTVIDGQAYDTETGENITDQVYIEPVVSVAQRQGAQIKANLKRHEDENGGYVFAFFHSLESIQERFPSLSQPDLSRLMFLGTYVSYNQGEPSHGYLTYDNGVKITKKSLGQLLGMSRNRFAEFYKRLVSEEIINEMADGIALNPTVFYRGENLADIKGDYQYTRLFRRTVRELYTKFKVRSIKKLGVVYQILPYVNFNFNIVCNNPQQVINGKIETMQLQDLAAKLGYDDYKHLLKNMREIKIDDQPVFKFVDDGKDRRSSYVIVNPNVIYAGNGKHLDGLKVLFK